MGNETIYWDGLIVNKLGDYDKVRDYDKEKYLKGNKNHLELAGFLVSEGSS